MLSHLAQTVDVEHGLINLRRHGFGRHRVEIVTGVRHDIQVSFALVDLEHVRDHLQTSISCVWQKIALQEGTQTIRCYLEKITISTSDNICYAIISQVLRQKLNDNIQNLTS